MEVLNQQGEPEGFIPAAASPRKLLFTGSGSEYFAVLLLNWVLTTITFGLYYPWARARSMSYLYGNTELEGSRFAFHGTGRQMFVGFIKAIAVFVLIYGIFIGSSLSDSIALKLLGLLIFYAGFLVLIPLAVHGGFRYRMAKSSWRNIHFGYRGEKGKLVEIFAGGAILSSLTLGIYTSWLTTDLRRYIIGNVRFGSIRFQYTGTGGQLFWINFKGIVLSVLSLGIYLFWYFRNWTRYYINHIYVEQGDNSYPVKINIDLGEFIIFQVVNFILLAVTFGLATAWIRVRTFDFFFQRLELPGEIDLDMVAQTETDFNDATGEDITDMMDLGII